LCEALCHGLSDATPFALSITTVPTATRFTPVFTTFFLAARCARNLHFEPSDQCEVFDVKQRATTQQPIRIDYVSHGIGRVELRRFDPSRDSFVALTALLHRAFARLGAMGIHCTCVDQTVEVTRARASRGDCYVAVCDGKIVGTMTLYAPDRESLCELYRCNDTASMRQFGVEPGWQARGIGTLLLAFADHWAATRGYSELALDTPQPATHLISFYRGQGFRIVDFVRFDGKLYDSAILSRAPVAARTLARWTHRIDVPRARVARAA
jgi:GNAT superfamily N-acetyltransferase